MEIRAVEGVPHRLPWLSPAGFAELAWMEWGEASAPPVLCVHGLTRTGRDFDDLAAGLAARGFRVLCPDLPGRGESSWLANPALYQPPTYVAALSTLLAVVGRPVDWIGTSLGGICGMMAAATPHAPIRKLVLNDVGARIPLKALAEIGAYMEKAPPYFADMAALEKYIRHLHAGFGPLTDAQWHHIAVTSGRYRPDGRLVLQYDPAIATPVLASPFLEVDLTALWQAITAPTLVVRGAESQLLPADILASMGEKPGVETATIPHCGHAPALMDSAQIRLIAEFLERP